jgi:hypothetical protein
MTGCDRQQEGKKKKEKTKKRKTQAEPVAEDLADWFGPASNDPFAEKCGIGSEDPG